MTKLTQHLTPLAHSAQNRCFGCGPANPAGLRLKFLLADDATVVCLTSVSAAFEGPPGYLHGGIISTLLDEIMSKALRARGVTAMTRKLEAEFLRPVPSETSIRMEGRILHEVGRKHWAEAKILNEAGEELARGRGLFVEARAPESLPRRPSAPASP